MKREPLKSVKDGQRTAKKEILKALEEAGRPLAIHEFVIEGYSQNNIGTRLPELAKAGLVAGRMRDGSKFKEWFLVKAGQQELPL